MCVCWDVRGVGEWSRTSMVEPDKVRHPRGVRVAGDDNVVADVVRRQMVERAVAVCLVAVPRIIVEWVDVAIC